MRVDVALVGPTPPPPCSITRRLRCTSARSASIGCSPPSTESASVDQLLRVARCTTSVAETSSEAGGARTSSPATVRTARPSVPLDRADPMCRRLPRSPDSSRSPARPRDGCGAFGGCQPIARIHVLAPPGEQSDDRSSGWSRTGPPPSTTTTSSNAPTASGSPHVHALRSTSPGTSSPLDLRRSSSRRLHDGGLAEDDMCDVAVDWLSPATSAGLGRFLRAARPTGAREVAAESHPEVIVAERSVAAAGVRGLQSASTRSTSPATAAPASISPCRRCAGRSRSTSTRRTARPAGVDSDRRRDRSGAVDRLVRDSRRRRADYGTPLRQHRRCARRATYHRTRLRPSSA